jgi:hypothetical protein
MLWTRQRKQAEVSIGYFIREIGQAMLRNLTPTINANNLTWDEFPVGRPVETGELGYVNTARYSIDVRTQKRQNVISVDVVWFYTMQSPVIALRIEVRGAEKSGEKTERKFLLYQFEEAVTAMKEAIIPESTIEVR